MKLDLDTLNGSRRECGCCETPGCCPPLIQCQSGYGRAQAVGWFNEESDGSDSDEASKTRYLEKIRTDTGISPADTLSTYPTGGGTYTSRTRAMDWEKRFVQEYSQAFKASIAGAYFTGTCETTDAEFSYHCTYTGGWVEENFAPYFSSGSWHNFRSSREVVTFEDIEGDPDPAHAAWVIAAAAWDAAHPDFVAAHAAWATAKALHDAAYAAWLVLHAAWVAGGSVGTAPVEPPPFTDVEPPARPAEPPEFYPPCTLKTTHTVTTWERVDGEVVLVDNGEHGLPNPRTYVNIPGDGLGSSDTTYSYASAVTYAEFFELANAWLEARANFNHASDSGSDGCEAGVLCQATREMVGYDEAITAILRTDFFRYRIKLNKCCAWKSIRSEWVQIFYPKEWLEWLAIKEATVGSDEIPPEPEAIPVKTPKVWVWAGTPPRCHGSDSLSGSDSDPYDYEPMWSPWSPVIQVPNDEEGTIANRNYKQKCYAAPVQSMPGVFGTYEHSESGSV
ncbi:MAG: hypothetical protein ABIS50_15090 [Luteolibacter sp.]|uniref:hypothetical protein n=1 Tax=Luteolibacter sp. TaxID=1962973 RepID=UPI003264621A